MRGFWAFCGAGVLVGCNAVLDIEPGRPRPADSTANAPDCSTHGDCLDQNSETRPRACIARRCVELISDECPLLLPQSDRLWLDNLRSDPEPVIIGAYASVAPNLYGPVPRTFDLALTEFTREVQGLPRTGGGRRPVVALVCGNRYDDEAALDRSIDHLAFELEVPGVISQLATEDLQRVFERSADRHLFFANTLGSEINDRVIPDGLLWSMLPRERELAPIYEPLFQLIVEHLR